MWGLTISNCNRLQSVHNQLRRLIKGVHKFRRKKVWGGHFLYQKTCGGVTFSTISNCIPHFPFQNPLTTSFVHEQHMCTIGQAIHVLILYQILKPCIRLLINHSLQVSIMKWIIQIQINPKNVLILKVIIGVLIISIWTLGIAPMMTFSTIVRTLFWFIWIHFVMYSCNEWLSGNLTSGLKVWYKIKICIA